MTWPSRRPSIRARIEVVDFKAGHIFDQWHPGFVSFSDVGIVLRFSQKTKIQPAALFVSRLQPQGNGKVIRRIACKQSGARATAPSYFVPLALAQLDRLSCQVGSERTQALPLCCEQFTQSVTLRVRGSRIRLDIQRSHVRLH